MIFNIIFSGFVDYFNVVFFFLLFGISRYWDIKKLKMLNGFLVSYGFDLIYFDGFSGGFYINYRIEKFN